MFLFVIAPRHVAPTNKVSKEGNCDDLVHGLVQRVKCKGQIEEHVGVGHHEGETSSGSCQKTGILAQVEKRDCGC